jgi:hypothetical protein
LKKKKKKKLASFRGNLTRSWESLLMAFWGKKSKVLELKEIETLGSQLRKMKLW